MGAPDLLAGLVRELHHVAIAVPSLAEARALYVGVLGMRAVAEPEFVPGQGVNVLVLFAGSQRVELVEPAADDSPVTKFLATRGAGIHHLAWRVDDLERALAAVAERGVRLIHATPQVGSHGTRIAFLHPKATGGVLMELVEDPASAG
jgi:methylmalonyl-CoA/ethylmalonyl-CoA epimerase